MPSVSKVKKEMDFNKDLRSLLSVMKGIATSQYQSLEEKYDRYDEIFPAIESFFELIDLRYVRHPFAQGGAGAPTVVAITSDQGLLGGLNLQVILGALQCMESESSQLVVVGERGQRYASERGVSCVGFPGIEDDQRYVQAMQLRDYCFEMLAEGKVTSLKIVYPRALNFVQQQVEAITVVPVSEWEMAKRENLLSPLQDTLVESKLGEMIEYMVYVWLGQKLYQIMGLARLAELGARAAHLEGSEQELDRVGEKLKLQYFRQKHEMIDQSMRELFGARIVFGGEKE